MIIVTIIVLLVVIGLTATITVFVTKKEDIENVANISKKYPQQLYKD